jgi:hypothetical protein
MLKVQLSRIGKPAKRSERQKNDEILYSNGMQAMQKWFREWYATQVLDHASIDCFMNAALLHQCIMTQEKCGGPHFLYMCCA